MFKNKTKLIALLLAFFLLVATPFAYADNETSSESDTMLISEDIENAQQNNDATPISDTSESKPAENSDENSVNAENSNSTTSEEDSYKKNDVYLTGDNVTIDYIVDGNLFVMANTVTINSQIGGDAFIMAKNIIVNDKAYIFNNLFAMAESIEVKGVVYDVYALAKDFNLSGGYIYRDAKVSCKNVNINGAIGRNAFVNCSNINFNTDGNDKGTIYGNLKYAASSEFNFEDKNVVNGTIEYKAPNASPDKSVGAIISSYIFDLGCFLTFVIIIWLVCLWIAPKFLADTNKFVGKKTLNVFGTGLLTLIVVPVACIILLLLQLTSSISLLTIALYVLALIVAKSIFTIVANNYLCSKLNINKKSATFGMLIVTGIIVWVITELPFIGGIVAFIISVLGLGVLISSILPKREKKTKESKSKEEKKFKKSSEEKAKKEISDKKADTKKDNK